MSYKEEIKNFSYKIHNSAIELDPFKENGFVIASCQIMHDAGIIEDYEVMHFEKKVQHTTYKINASNSYNNKEALDLFVCNFSDFVEPKKIDSKMLKSEAKKLHSFFKDSLASLSGLLPKNTDVYSIARSIKDNAKKLKKVNMYVLTDCICPIETKVTDKIKGIDVVIEFIDLGKLYQYSVIGKISDQINVEFDLSKDKIECVKSGTNPRKVESYLAIIPGETLYRLYEYWGSQLMELNVRSFLQVSGKVNKGIRTTLIEEPNMFFAYNNGIAATAEKIKFVVEDGVKYIKEIVGFQIVNGGQTTASIHRAKKNDDIDLDEISIPAKISVIQKEDIRTFVPLISRYSNSQNAVKQSDFHSDNIYLKKIDELSKKIFIPGESGRWFFERKTGEFQNEKHKHSNTPETKNRFNTLIPPSRKISKEEIAKYHNCWECLPHIACMGVQKNFIYFMNDHAVVAVKEKIIDEDYYKSLIAKAILYRGIEKIIKKSELKAYKSQICNYTISLLSFLSKQKFNFSAIWQDQQISNELSDIIFNMIEKINTCLRKSAGDLNPGEWLKKADCWKELKKENFLLPKNNIPIELVVSVKKSKSRAVSFDEEYYEHLDLCKQVTEKSWYKIAKFIQENPELESEFHGMCLTLAKMAADEWYNDPTPKMAEDAYAIIDLALENEVIKI